MPGWTWLVIVVGAALVLDRLLLFGETRGWVHWRNSTPATGSASSAMLGMQAVFEPAAEHVAEERRRSAADIEVADDDDPLP